MSTKNLNEYYADIAQKVLELVKDEKFSEALSILDEELDQPYIPADFYHNLNQIKLDIECQLKEEEYSQKVANLSKLEIWNLVYDEKQHKFDDVYFNILLSKYNNELDDIDFALINKIFVDKKIDNVSKSIMINNLRELKINHTFSLYNSFLDKLFDFNPMLNFELDEQVVEIANKIDEIFLKDPSKSEIALSLLQVLATKFIPKRIMFDNNDIINTVVNMTNSLFSEENIIENEISNILKEYIY